MASIALLTSANSAVSRSWRKKERGNYVVAGVLDLEMISRLIGVQFRNCTVRAYTHAYDHANICHSSVLSCQSEFLAETIAHPTFIGQHPHVVRSVELYHAGMQLLVAIREDRHGYLFVASAFKMLDWDYKIPRRLASGRIVHYVS